MEQIRKVIDTAWVMFKRFGVRSVSMDDVAREMSISKKTLYRCFRDKNELICKTLDRDLELIEQKVDEIRAEDKNPVRQVVKIATFVSEYLKDINPSMIYDLQKYHPDIHAHFISYRQNTFMKKVMENLQSGMELGYYRKNLDLQNTAQFYLCLMDHGPEMLNEHNKKQSYAELYQEIIRYHLYAIATPKGLKEASDFLQ